ncbi:EF-P beta-lysylation protein EpmB [Thiorhodovibrio frisius]|uniref:L-lysine 2,3-aminomutase n=1 Tax=Thiorhodovibrio frisius TaxID=631362 RepID=H8Z5G7_9GAMM|nr:EF-P beta-lysylation protein EpmB [Thiorhodovibrio frisius]EIC19513.1 lysine-2,3-aminomutase-related protein [Thiorhodovibrio frisius]WPL20524.1 L-lysine 2,3-aminomutase [Thiorhodovibrio frisius]
MPKEAERGDWRADLRASIRDLPTLCRRLDLDPTQIAAGKRAAASFALCAPHAWMELIEPGNPDDPLLRQILPTTEETRIQATFGPDPVGDRHAEQTPGLLCKYPGRALLLVTGACALHCRYCFRRCFPFATSLNHRDRALSAIRAIAARPDINEVILSGGDPLLLNDHSLDWLLRALDGIGHLKRIRLHSRIPIALPSRVDDNLRALLTGGRLPRVLVVQTNHPHELGEAASAALTRLRADGITLLNQSVLLHGVNASPEILQTLSERLFALGVLPYYLHLLDRVTGSAHFAVPLATCVKVVEQLRARLPGYLMPRVVAEQPGASSKTPLEHVQRQQQERPDQGSRSRARNRLANRRARV